MKSVFVAGVMAVVVAGAGAGLAWRFWPQQLPQAPSLSAEAFHAAYATPLPALEGRPRVFFLGHSLIGHDMLDYLGQMAGHDWNSQLGWGASLNNHWTGEVPGFAEENLPPVWRPAGEAADSGDYPAVVLTEMVELQDAIRYHDSARALGDWAARFRQARPDARIYLYETWHRTGDAKGWLNRIDTDLATLWQGQLMRVAMARPEVGTIYLIPGGQVLAAASRAAEAGELPGLSGAADFLSDDIHLSDLGARLVAMTQYAVIYGRPPAHLQQGLHRRDGTPATAFRPETQRLLEELVWRVVSSYPETGVAVEADPAAND